MIKFKALIAEEIKKKRLTRQQFVEKTYQKANTGTVSAAGIKKLAARLENGGTLRYNGFPEWVLRAWTDPSMFPVIPLLNNRFFEVKNVVNGTGEITSLDVTYGGWAVDSQRNVETSVMALNLGRSEDVDIRKYAELVLFKRAVNEAKKIIANRKQRDGELTQGQNAFNVMSGSIY